MLSALFPEAQHSPQAIWLDYNRGSGALVCSGWLYTPIQKLMIRVYTRRYRGWLEKSRQGKGEYLSRNNHGLYFEVQLASINAFVGDIPR